MKAHEPEGEKRGTEEMLSRLRGELSQDALLGTLLREMARNQRPSQLDIFKWLIC